MQCIAVNGVKFDQKSIEAIEDIKRRNDLAMALSGAISIGTLANIFLGNDPLKSAYNISQTDFELFARAMSAIPIIQRRVIADIAREQQLYHFGNEREFWRGIENGCDVQ